MKFACVHEFAAQRGARTHARTHARKRACTRARTARQRGGRGAAGSTAWQVPIGPRDVEVDEHGVAATDNERHRSCCLPAPTGGPLRTVARCRVMEDSWQWRVAVAYSKGWTNSASRWRTYAHAETRTCKRTHTNKQAHTDVCVHARARTHVHMYVNMRMLHTHASTQWLISSNTSHIVKPKPAAGNCACMRVSIRPSPFVCMRMHATCIRARTCVHACPSFFFSRTGMAREHACVCTHVCLRRLHFPLISGEPWLPRQVGTSGCCRPWALHISIMRTHAQRALRARTKLHCYRYLLLSAPPDKEGKFQSLKAKYGSKFAFHG